MRWLWNKICAPFLWLDRLFEWSIESQVALNIKRFHRITAEERKRFGVGD